MRGGRGFRSYPKNDISRTLLRERLVRLFDDIDISGLGVCDSFHGFWELGHGWLGDGGSESRGIKVYKSDGNYPSETETSLPLTQTLKLIHLTVSDFRIVAPSQSEYPTLPPLPLYPAHQQKLPGSIITALVSRQYPI